jgi:hypothetical protein
MFYFLLAKLTAFFSPLYEPGKNTRFSEMAIRSLCGLALLGYLSLGHQSIKLNKVRAVLAKFIVTTFLNFYLIGRSSKGVNYHWISIMYQHHR